MNFRQYITEGPTSHIIETKNIIEYTKKNKQGLCQIMIIDPRYKNAIEGSVEQSKKSGQWFVKLFQQGQSVIREEFITETEAFDVLSNFLKKTKNFRIEYGDLTT